MQWRFDAEVTLDVKRGTGPGDALATCVDSRGPGCVRMHHVTGATGCGGSLTGYLKIAGDRFSLSEEQPALASSLYVATPGLKVAAPPHSVP